MGCGLPHGVAPVWRCWPTGIYGIWLVLGLGIALLVELVHCSMWSLACMDFKSQIEVAQRGAFFAEGAAGTGTPTPIKRA
jgi:hypothetical protein